MLVLSRQVGEAFRVGDNVEVRILGVSTGAVKIGVVAPREVPVYRSELAEINREAAGRWTRSELERLAGRLRGKKSS